jgi:hypothetical protein
LDFQWFEIVKVDSGADDISRAHIESGKVPEAGDDVTFEPALVERVGQVAAGVVDGVDLAIDFSEQNLLVGLTVASRLRQALER